MKRTLAELIDDRCQQYAHKIFVKIWNWIPLKWYVW